jgi:hypothetical protein
MEMGYVRRVSDAAFRFDRRMGDAVRCENPVIPIAAPIGRSRRYFTPAPSPHAAAPPGAPIALLRPRAPHATAPPVAPMPAATAPPAVRARPDSPAQLPRPPGAPRSAGLPTRPRRPTFSPLASVLQ